MRVAKAQQRRTDTGHMPVQLSRRFEQYFGALAQHAGLPAGAELLSEAELESLYALGHTSYGQGNYLEAARIFWYLIRCDCTEAKYYVAAGACMQMQQHYQEAAMAYGMACLLNQQDPTPLLHLAQCFQAAGHPVEAHAALQEFLERTTASAEHAAARKRATALLQSIELSRNPN